jgi:hypothetical protein
MTNTSLRPSKVETWPTIANLDEQLRRRAYEIYEQRGRDDGHDVEDWLQAESELRLRSAA